MSPLVPVILDSASGRGLSEAAAPGVGYTIASQPATPVEAKKTITQSTISVASADPKPNGMLRRGLTASSATLASPSSPRKNQIAKGTEAHTPIQPFGKAFCVTCRQEKWGNATPQNNSSSKTATIVTASSKPAAARTP